MATVEVLAKDYKSQDGSTAAKGEVFVRKGGKLLTRPEANPLAAGEKAAMGTSVGVQTGSDLTGRQAFENFNLAAKAKLERYQKTSAQYTAKGEASVNALQQADAGIILEESEDKGFSPTAQNRMREAKRAGTKAQLGILSEQIGTFGSRQQAFLQTWQAMRDVMTDLYKDDLETPPQNVLNAYKTGLETGAITLKDIPVEDMKHVLPLVDLNKLPKNEEEVDIFTDANYNRVRVVRDHDGNIRTEILGQEPRPRTGGSGGGGTADERTQAKIDSSRGSVLEIIDGDIGEDGFTSIGTYRKAQAASGLASDDFANEYSSYLSPKTRAIYGVGKTTNAFNDDVNSGGDNDFENDLNDAFAALQQIKPDGSPVINAEEAKRRLIARYPDKRVAINDAFADVE